MNFLFDLFGNWLQTFIKGILLKIAGFALEMTATFGNGFWEDEVVWLFLDFATWFNILIAAVCSVILCLDIVEARGRVDWASVFGNVFKTIAYIFFSRYIGLLSFQLANMITTSLNFSIPDGTMVENIMQTAMNLNPTVDQLILVIITIAFVAFAVMCMLRCGALFVLMMTSGFYVTDIMRGETTKLGEWLRQVIGNSTTYLMQYILFYLGFLYFSSGSLISCFICWATMFSIPKILLKYSMSSGTKGVFSAIGSSVSQGLSFAGRFIK